MLQEIINTLDPRKVKWWNKDEWYEYEKHDAHYIVEKHDCPSWDIETCYAVVYKNKDTCEERIRKETEYLAGKTTKFKDPKDSTYEWFQLGRKSESRWIEQFDTYEGPVWEPK